MKNVKAEDYRIFWGEAHDNTYQFDVLSAPMDEVCRRAASHLDFYAAAYYTPWAAAFRPGGHPSESGKPTKLILEGWKPAERLEREWAEVQQATAQANDPGTFVTFPGYEWQGDGSGGDHNVFYLREGPPIFRVDTLAELYGKLRGLDALAIPHHTGYRSGMRGRDWSVFDEELSPFSELFSVHGCSETDEEWIGLRQNSHMGPGMGAGAYQAALSRGLHVGAICSTDNWGRMPGHYGRGRMACLARELTRESLWEAFKARRVYGVTGDLIEVDFRVNNARMGQIITADGPRRIEVNVVGWDAIDRIELLRGDRVISTHCHKGTWQAPRPGQRTRFKMRIEAGWGPRLAEADAIEHRWDGELRVAGGRMVGVERCWVSPGQQQPSLEGDRATFRMLSSTSQVQEAAQNANVFEFEADPGDELVVKLNGLTERGAVADFAAGSRIMWFKDECVRTLAQSHGMAPGSPERDDVYYHCAFKAKLHRAMPECAWTAALAIEDDEPLSAETHYRVRVEQRNGQRAWSSPIWVKPPEE